MVNCFCSWARSGQSQIPGILQSLFIMDDLIFVADYDYEKQNETELSFLVGDTIRVTANEGGWFYGKHTRTEKCGWVSPSYGHTRQDTPYNKMSADVKEEKRNLLLKNIILTEKEFVNMLGEFVQTVITPFNLRDTPFKRSFMGDSSVAVSFSLLQELYKACFNFENVLKASKSDIELANAYIQFAPSLLIFAQYASENAKLLNAIKSCRQLSEVVPESFNIIQTLIHPMQHSTLYKSLFQEYIWLTARTNPDMSSLEVALDMIIAQSNVVDARMKEEEESWKLLNLQAQCTSCRLY